MGSSEPREEDLVFAEWRSTPTEALEDKLRRLLFAHANAVTAEKLGVRDPEVANLAVYLAIKHAKTFRGESKFSTWFHTIVKNLCNRKLRERILARRLERPLDDLTAEELMALSTTETPDTTRLVEQLEESLEPADRELLALKRQGLTSPEIAVALGLAPGAVRVRWHRLRQQIVRWLGGEGRTHARTLVGADCDGQETAAQG